MAAGAVETFVLLLYFGRIRSSFALAAVFLVASGDTLVLSSSSILLLG
jgi:hypothetical protein